MTEEQIYNKLFLNAVDTEKMKGKLSKNEQKVIESENMVESLKQVLINMHKIDKDFTEKKFLQGASKAYELVLKAYS